MENSQIIAFFKTLSRRNWVEQNLSDMLWSLLKTNYEFRQIFFSLLKSHDPNNTLTYVSNESFIDVIRESTETDIGRPDFKLLFSESKELLLEVKKYDRNYHPEYDLSGKDICILTLNSVNGLVDQKWIKITWRELVNLILESEDDLIRGFGIFIKGVFGMKDLKKVKSFLIEDLYYLNIIIETALLELQYENDERVSINRQIRSFSDEGSGYNFNHTLNEKENIYPWIGINYNEEKESNNPFGLMFWLNDCPEHLFINKELSDKYSNPLTNLLPESDIYHLNFGDNQTVIMPKDWKKTFLNLNCVDDQVKYVKDFINNILNIIDGVHLFG